MNDNVMAEPPEPPFINPLIMEMPKDYVLIDGELFEVLYGIPQIRTGPVNKRRKIGPERSGRRGFLL